MVGVKAGDANEIDFRRAVERKFPFRANVMRALTLNINRILHMKGNESYGKLKI